MNKNSLTTPNTIDRYVKEFCNSICENSKPIFIDVDSSYNYRLGECFNNVPTHLELYEGSQIFGWIIWYQLKIYIEAEFHSVWMTNNGRLIDITPKIDKENLILFLPDPNMTWDKKFIPNKRKALCTNSIVKNKIKYLEEFDKLKEKFSDKEGRPNIPPIEMAGLARKFPQTSVTKRNEPCPCGSGRKYKKCCLN